MHGSLCTLDIPVKYNAVDLSNAHMMLPVAYLAKLRCFCNPSKPSNHGTTKPSKHHTTKPRNNQTTEPRNQKIEKIILNENYWEGDIQNNELVSACTQNKEVAPGATNPQQTTVDGCCLENYFELLYFFILHRCSDVAFVGGGCGLVRRWKHEVFLLEGGVGFFMLLFLLLLSGLYILSWSGDWQQTQGRLLVTKILATPLHWCL